MGAYFCCSENGIETYSSGLRNSHLKMHTLPPHKKKCQARERGDTRGIVVGSPSRGGQKAGQSPRASPFKHSSTDCVCVRTHASTPAPPEPAPDQNNSLPLSAWPLPFPIPLQLSLKEKKERKKPKGRQSYASMQAQLSPARAKLGQSSTCRQYAACVCC